MVTQQEAKKVRRIFTPEQKFEILKDAWALKFIHIPKTPRADFSHFYPFGVLVPTPTSGFYQSAGRRVAAHCHTKDPFLANIPRVTRIQNG
jgi:hypothetical protein